MAAMRDLGKTPWVDRSLKTVWERVVAAAPKPEWVPRLLAGRKFSLEEYGCGNYGCVFPTSDPAVVAKLTSDPTEAFFVGAALSIGDWPEGIVRYYAIYRIPGEYLGPQGGSAKQALFVLWREAADAVGRVPGNAKLSLFRTYARDVRRELKDVQRLSPGTEHTPLTVAEEARRMEDWARGFLADVNAGRFRDPAEAEAEKRRRDALPWWQAIARTVAVGLVRLESLAGEMENLGSALRFYLQNDLLLADVHTGNIGLVEGRAVITDPGHAVPLSRRWETVQVPVLP